MNRAYPAFVVFLIVAVGPRNGWAQKIIQPEEASGTILNDLNGSRELEMSVGDFNGDGLDDVAMILSNAPSPRPVLLCLAPFEKNAMLSTRVNSTIVLEGPNLFLSLPSVQMADLNHDGKDDLILLRRDQTTLQSQLVVIRGSTVPFSWIDLGAVQADMTLAGLPGAPAESWVAVGDFDGDNNDDLAVLISSLPTSVCSFVRGGTEFNSVPRDVTSSAQFARLSLNGYATKILTGNFNGDSFDDLAMRVGRGGPYGEHTDVDLFYGTSPFPVAGGASAVTNVTLMANYHNLGGAQYSILPRSAGDVTGDHKDELIVEGDSYLFPHWILDGNDLSQKGPLLTQEPSKTGSIPFFPIDDVSTKGTDEFFCFDFDGEGVEDLFFFYDYSGMNGRLSTDQPTGAMVLGNMGGSTLGWNGVFTSAGTGDFNGDGYQDLVAYENFESIYPPYGAVRFLWGFRPLINPTITVTSGPNERRRVTLSLSVKGDPAGMYFSGQVDSTMTNKWVPFRETQEVLLSPGGGSKTIGVRFRNAVGRESETVETSVPVAVGNTPVVTDTNRLRPGGGVSFECHARAPGTIRADLFGPGGERILELENRSVESGIYPVQWNGQNSHGNRVARGVYYLVIEVDGERTRKEILVE